MIYADPTHVVETPYGCLHAMHPDDRSWTQFTGRITPPGQHTPVTAGVFLDGLHGHAGTVSWYPTGPDQRVDLAADDPLDVVLRNAVNGYMQSPSGGRLMTQRLTRLITTADGLLRSDRDGPEARTMLLRLLVPWMTTDPEIREIAHGLADGWDHDPADLIDAAEALLTGTPRLAWVAPFPALGELCACHPGQPPT